MRFDTNPQETRSALENIARDCQDRHAILKKPTDDPNIQRCFSAPLDERFCLYQTKTVNIEEPQGQVPFPVTATYYQCTYNEGDSNRAR